MAYRAKFTDKVLVIVVGQKFVLESSEGSTKSIQELKKIPEVEA